MECYLATKSDCHLQNIVRTRELTVKGKRTQVSIMFSPMWNLEKEKRWHERRITREEATVGQGKRGQQKK